MGDSEILYGIVILFLALIAMGNHSELKRLKKELKDQGDESRLNHLHSICQNQSKAWVDQVKVNEQVIGLVNAHSFCVLKQQQEIKDLQEAINPTNERVIN